MIQKLDSSPLVIPFDIPRHWAPPFTTPSDRAAVITAAVDYRGDVTLNLTTGEPLIGYVFNFDGSIVSLYPKDSADTRSIPLAEITAVIFTGVDTAAGKSWDVWLKKVAEIEATGEIAEIYPESLDD